MQYKKTYTGSLTAEEVHSLIATYLTELGFIAPQLTFKWDRVPKNVGGLEFSNYELLRVDFSATDKK